jgi:hypothetical protein
MRELAANSAQGQVASNWQLMLRCHLASSGFYGADGGSDIAGEPGGCENSGGEICGEGGVTLKIPKGPIWCLRKM